MKERLKKLNDDYRNICNSYLKLFCEIHELEYDEDCWIGDMPGGVTCVSDYFVDLNTIIEDLTTETFEGRTFEDWYDYCLRLRMIDYNISTPNLKSYKMCCPIKSEEDIKSLEFSKKKVDEVKELFEKTLEEFKK